MVMVCVMMTFWVKGGDTFGVFFFRNGGDEASSVATSTKSDSLLFSAASVATIGMLSSSSLP